MKQWEDHQRKEGNVLLIPLHSLHRSPRNLTDPRSPHQTGKPVSHAFAKELVVGFVGGEVDKLAETKGMDFYDGEKAQHRAKKGAERMYDEHYVDMNDYNPERRDWPKFRD